MCQVRIKASDFVAVYENLQLKKKVKCDQEAKDEVKEEYQCQKCGRIFSHQRSLNAHKRYECGVEPKFVSSFCGHRSRQKVNLKIHMDKHHLKTNKYDRNINDHRKKPDSKYKCDRCFGLYAHRDSLMSHKRNVCGVEAKFECYHCGHKSKRKNNLLIHIVNKHLKKKL